MGRRGCWLVVAVPRVPRTQRWLAVRVSDGTATASHADCSPCSPSAGDRPPPRCRLRVHHTGEHTASEGPCSLVHRGTGSAHSLPAPHTPTANDCRTVRLSPVTPTHVGLPHRGDGHTTGADRVVLSTHLQPSPPPPLNAHVSSPSTPTTGRTAPPQNASPFVAPSMWYDQTPHHPGSLRELSFGDGSPLPPTLPQPSIGSSPPDPRPPTRRRLSTQRVPTTPLAPLVSPAHPRVGCWR